MTLWGDAGSGAGDYTSLGDVVCIEGDCKEGEARVRELQHFFDQVTAAGKPHAEDLARKYQAAVNTVVASFNEADSSLSRQLLPFSTRCCEIKGIGEQADKVRADIAADAGVASGGNVEAPSSTTDKVVKGLQAAALIFTVGSLVSKLSGNAPARARAAGAIPAVAGGGRRRRKRP